MKRRRTDSPESLGDILKGSLEKWDFGPTLLRYEVVEKWPDLVGPQVAAKSRAVGLQGDILLVEVVHPAWVQELNLLKNQLLAKIARLFPRSGVKNIRFSLQ
ncbi:MAG: DUF721 domain-containing protein [bacterium]